MRAAPTSSAARRWEFCAATDAQRQRVLPARRRRQAAASTATSSAASSAGRSCANKAFFFADSRGFSQTRGQTATSTIPTVDAAAGILAVDVRNPLTGVAYPAGTPIPMTAFARKVLTDLPAPTKRRRVEQLLRCCRSSTNDTTRRAARSTSSINPRLSAFGRYRLARRRHLRRPDHPAAVGRRRQRRDLRAQQAVRGRRHLHAGRRVAARGALRLVEHRGRQESGGAGGRAAGAGQAYGITGLPTDPRVAGGLPTQLITGYSDLGRQATNPQWQYPTVYNPKVNYTWLSGRHSLKTGYEFQHIQTEVQDVNPLYGRDSYAGQFTRPAGAAANNLYNLADFMFGLRSTYALSNILVANLRQNMHFLYLQDDWRVNDRLTLNLGLRYEYATPWVEKNNILSNFDPAAKRMVIAPGRLAGGSLHHQARSQQLRPAPRLRLHADAGRPWSAAATASATCTSIAPAAPTCCRSTARRSSTRSSCRPPTPGRLPHDAAGLSGGADRSVALQPAGRQHHLHAERLSLEPGAELVRLGAAGVVAAARSSTSPTSATARDDLLLFANFNQARPTTAPGTLTLQQRRPIPEFADITYSFNGGKSRYHAFQSKFDWRIGARLADPQLADAVGDERQRRRIAREPATATSRRRRTSTTSTPTSGCRRTTSPTTARRASSRPAVRPRAALRRATPRRWWTRFSAAGRWPASTASTSGETVTLTYTPTAALQVVGHPAGLPRRQQLPPERHRRGADAGGPAHGHELVQPRRRGHPDRPEPAVRQRPAQRVRGPMIWQVDLAASKRFAMPWRPRHVRVPRRVLQPVQPHELPRAERQPQQRRVRHDHRDLRSADHPVRVQAELLRAAPLRGAAGRGVASLAPAGRGSRREPGGRRRLRAAGKDRDC